MKNNKKIIMLLIVALITFSININVYAADSFNFCNSSSINAFRIIGHVLFAFKIIAPMMIIIFGMIDFGKAAISNDEKALKVSTGALIRRIIAGIFIFFVPSLVFGILTFATDSDDADKAVSSACTKCMLKTSICDTYQAKLPSK